MNLTNLRQGAYGGLLGGAMFGAMMGVMGMLPMVGRLVGQPSALAGLLVHMVNSALIGAGFAVIFGRSAVRYSAGLVQGLLYGILWWFLGPLTLMPLLMGMGLGINWNAAAAQSMLPSLIGHAIYGVILGTSYVWLHQRNRLPATAPLS